MAAPKVTVEEAGEEEAVESERRITDPVLRIPGEDEPVGHPHAGDDDRTRRLKGQSGLCVATGRDASRPEGRVQRAIGKKLRQPDIGRGDDLTVATESERGDLIAIRHEHDSGVAEARVERTVEAVAHERGARGCEATGDDLVVALPREREDDVGQAVREIGRDEPAVAESGVERAGRVVPREQEVVVDRAADHDPAVAREHGVEDGTRPAAGARGRHLAADPERCVERTVGEIPGEADPESAAAEAGSADADDLAVGLLEQPHDPVFVPAERGRDSSPDAERRIEAPVRSEAGERPVEIVIDLAGPADHHLPVRLEQQHGGDVLAVEIRRRAAIGAERRIRLTRCGRKSRRARGDDEAQDRSEPGEELRRHGGEPPLGCGVASHVAIPRVNGIPPPVLSEIQDSTTTGAVRR